MSRSNPTERAANPATRWFEWDGEGGVVRYYDKTAKQTITVGSDFPFVLLDELGTIRGWHEASKSGIYSNEVKDTREQPFLVKAFKGGILAQGLYRDIKDRVNASGGRFTTNCYILFAEKGAAPQLAVLQFKGASLNAWMEFRKEHRDALYEQGVRIKGYSEGKKGKIVFRVPRFTLIPLGADTQAAAMKLDTELQEYLRGYLSARKVDQADVHAPVEAVEPEYGGHSEIPSDDDIPFLYEPYPTVFWVESHNGNKNVSRLSGRKVTG